CAREGGVIWGYGLESW
nr:immunoglobulin heavy chain junction region [Macaca mulatta]